LLSTQQPTEPKLAPHAAAYSPICWEQSLVAGLKND